VALPIVAMEPAVKPAVAATRSGVVGVLATVGTLESARFAALLEQYAGDVEIVMQACPGLVEQVEAGELDSPATRTLVESYTEPLIAHGADTLVLGCTHFPFLRPVIAEVVGPDVRLIDTGEAVARQVVRRLRAEAQTTRAPSERFWSTGDLDAARRITAKLWGRPVSVSMLAR
jgi:glutamate racemase